MKASIIPCIIAQLQSVTMISNAGHFPPSFVKLALNLIKKFAIVAESCKLVCISNAGKYDEFKDTTQAK